MIKIILFTILFGSWSHAEEVRSFKNESEAGVVITGGNTEVSTVNLKQSNVFGFGQSSYSFNARYLHSSHSGVEQALQWVLGLKAEHLLNSHFSLFVGQILESNIYQNINQRYATDLGGKYFFQKNEKNLVWFAEAGYRFTRENNPTDFKNFNFIRLYSELENYFTETMSGKLGLEYLPNISVWKAYQFNGSLSLNTAVSSVFSLKNGFELRYNDEPPAGTKSLSDRIFTTALVAKF